MYQSVFNVLIQFAWQNGLLIADLGTGIRRADVTMTILPACD